MVKIKLDAKHKDYKKDRSAVNKLLSDNNVGFCQITGVDCWKSSIFSATKLDDMDLVRSIGQMESVTEISFEKD